MASISDRSFGDLLRQYREKADLTQEALAKRAGLSARGISDLERGINRAPWRQNTRALADALELDTAERERFIAARRHSASLRARSRGARSPQPNARPGVLRLIGREREQLQIERLLAGDGAPLLIFRGEPGIGKTRLLQYAEERARQAGWVVLRGGSHQSDGQHPYAPLVQALEDYLAEQPLTRRRRQVKGCEWMARLLPELIDATPIPADSWRLPPEQERRLMFAAVGRFVARVAEPGGALLVLDDLQWAAPDGLSLLAALLRSSVSSARPNRLRVIGASRDARLDPGHPLPTFVMELAHDGLASVTPLGPLEIEQADELLHAALEGFEGASQDEREAVVQRVVARAGGVPLFLMSFARELRDSRTDQRRSLATTDIPWDVAEMIRHWVNDLPATARQVLAVAAVYGRQAPLSLLNSASDLTERQVVEAVEAAVAARLLNETGGGACTFAHDLYREAVLANLSAVRKRMLHHRVAEALEADPLRAAAGPLAFHYGRGADADKAISYLERAGDQALALRAYVAAEAYYRNALDQLVAAPGASGRLWEKLGSLFMGCGKYDDAIVALEAAVSSYGHAGDPDGAGRAVAQIGWAHVRHGAADQGLSRVEPLLAPEKMAEVAPPAQVALWRAHAVLLFALNRYAEQLASARRAGALARATHDTEALAQSMRLEGLALVLLGRFDEALPVALETIRLAEMAGDLDSFSAALNDTAAIYRDRGELASSWIYSARSVEVAERLGDPTAIAFFSMSHGDNAYLLGDWAVARRNYERAMTVVRELGASWVAPYPLLAFGQLNLAEGHDEVAASLLDEALTGAERGHDLQALRCAQAVLAERDLNRGDAAAALQRLQPLLDPTTASEKDSIALLPLVGWARLMLGDLAGAAEALSHCMRRAEVAGARLVIVDALLAQARLHIHLGEWPHAEKALDDALDRARAMACPYAEAKARYVFGELHAATGAPVLAREEYQRALAICQRLGEQLYRARIERALSGLSDASRD